LTSKSLASASQNIRLTSFVGERVLESEYDVPEAGRLFKEDRYPTMPFVVLLEVSRQACGWQMLHVTPRAAIWTST